MSNPPVRPAAPLPLRPEGTVVTVGSFDGVHLGHQAVLAEMKKLIAYPPVGTGERLL